MQNKCQANYKKKNPQIVMIERTFSKRQKKQKESSRLNLANIGLSTKIEVMINNGSERDDLNN